MSNSACWKSSTIVAAMAFILINISVSAVFSDRQLKFCDAQFIQHQTLLEELETAKTKRWDALLLGSSVMECPLSLMDRVFRYEAQPIYFKQELEKTVSYPVNVLNATIEAGMVSDQYLLLRHYFKKATIPGVVVLGLTPRDFIDNRWRHPASSYIFKALAEPFAMDYLAWYLLDSEDTSEFFLNNLFPLYRYRTVIAVQFIEHLNQLRNQLVAKESNPEKSSSSWSSTNEAQRWQQSRNEYIDIYSSRSIFSRYDIQLAMLKQLISLLKKENIKLILLNMPLTDSNKELMPPGFYTRYKNDLSTLSKNSNIEYIDCSENGIFSNQDFHDTAHLNREGGKKITRILIPRLALEMR